MLSFQQLSAGVQRAYRHPADIAGCLFCQKKNAMYYNDAEPEKSWNGETK